jgi:hypothetical protein
VNVSYNLVIEAISKRKYSLWSLKRRLKKAERGIIILKKKHGPDVIEKSKKAADLANKVKDIRTQISQGY